MDDDENMSSVLSYISHLLIMLAKYLRVHLRFRINYHASRSSISDEVSRNSSNYPLYGKGFDRLAETWMTRDILLLLERRGIPSGLKIEGISGMLSQLNKLFETECP